MFVPDKLLNTYRLLLKNKTSAYCPPIRHIVLRLRTWYTQTVAVWILILFIGAGSVTSLYAVNPEENDNTRLASKENVDAIHEQVISLLTVETTRAIEKGERALELSLELEAEEYIANSLYYLGVANYYRGYHKASNYYYDQALLYFEKVGDTERIEALYNNMGVNYSMLSMYTESANYYNKSIQLARERDDRFGIAQTELNMGLLFHSGALYDQALDYTYRAKEFFEAQNDTSHVAISKLNLGMIYADVDHIQSLPLFEQALDMFRSINFIPYIYRAKHNIALYTMDQGDRSAALQMFEELLDADASDQLSVQDLSALYLNVATLLKRNEEHQSALEYVDRAADLHEQFSLPFSFQDLILSTYIDIYLDLNEHHHVRQKIDERDALVKNILEEQSAQALEELDIIHGLSLLRESYNLQTEQVAQQRRFLILLSVALVLLTGLLIANVVLRKDVRQKSVIIKLRDKINQQRRRQSNRESLIKLDEESNRNTESKQLDESVHQETNGATDRPDKLKQPETSTSKGDAESGDVVRSEPVKDELFEEICEVVQMQKLYLDVDLRVEHIAKELRTNTKYVSSSINKETGLNFNKFINMYRLEEAKYVMDSPNGNIFSLADIAFMVGFKNESTFYRNFKELMLTTPNEYRSTGVAEDVPNFIKLNIESQDGDPESSEEMIENKDRDKKQGPSRT